MSSPVPKIVRDNDTAPIGRSITLVAALGWLSSVPYALLVGPVDPKWVVAQALGAGIIPTVAGWVALWRTKGDLRGALWVTGWASAVLLLLAVWAGR